jgi:hypothetical protein
MLEASNALMPLAAGDRIAGTPWVLAEASGVGLNSKRRSVRYEEYAAHYKSTLDSLMRSGQVNYNIYVNQPKPDFYIDSKFKIFK